MKKMTFFSSPIGLGHVTRDSAIVQHIEEISTKFVTGNAAAKFLEQLQFDVQDAYIPPQFIVENGLLQNPLRWLWKYYKYYKECKNISSEIIKKENPHAVISDEDFASITIAQGKNIPTVLITDVLETRFTSGLGSLIERKMNHSMRDIMKKCDVVILPEIGDDKDNMKCVGPIVRTTNNSREELRKKFSFNKKTIVVSVGGTDAGKFLIEKTLNVKTIQDDSELVIVSGPSLKKDYGKNVRSLGFVNNLHEIIFAADLIISLAGKSTIDESKSYGTPGIFIPIKNHFEQEDNAKDEGFSYNDINKLDSLISQKLEEKRNPQNYDGAKKAAEIIKNIFPK
jgi:UDP-N-acetylglucosamine--N-acetylmuramyl-(pentapeptide) pyrophosphoryl-undecaprenol N-acetylglucosamine transferase